MPDWEYEMRTSSSTEKIFIWIGLLLIASGIIFNEWLLVSFFSPDGAIEPSTRIAIWLLGFTMVLVGLVLVRYKSKINGYVFREGDSFLKMILAGGIVLRIIVYIFLRFHNNDNHIAVVKFIADTGTIPISGQLGQASHPPLYYLMAAPLAIIGSPKVVQGLSLLLSIANLLLLYHLIKTTPLLRSLSARRHALLLAVLLPQFVIFSNFVSNDSLAFLVGTLTFLQAFRYIGRPTRANLVLLAVVLGIGLLTKGTLFAFVPVLFALVIVMQLRQGVNLKQHLIAFVTFAAISLTIGSYKYVQNMIHFGQPVIGRDELGHKWVSLQKGTYQGSKSIVDFNVVKLARHPSLSEHTKHSLPLLLYGTFWYSHIPESNFRATRRYPLSLLPGAIYLLAVIPTLLMLSGVATSLWRNRSPLALFKSPDSVFGLRLREIVVILPILFGLVLVLMWGLKHDAWSFFQSRLLFGSFFSIMILFGLGFEKACNQRPVVCRMLNVTLIVFYLVLGSYFMVEIGYILRLTLN
ncbi:MAG: hypothetical protein GWN00_28785 [Aliifodinibius sp.]|nr:hypothetical protein [Fodinibius sp.]NIY28653.1 hypothetical protein [Fodinibius sp.]